MRGRREDRYSKYLRSTLAEKVIHMGARIKRKLLNERFLPQYGGFRLVFNQVNSS